MIDHLQNPACRGCCRLALANFWMHRLLMGVWIRWTGTMEWNGGMDWTGTVEWNGMECGKQLSIKAHAHTVPYGNSYH